VLDDPSRENEGDLIIAADSVTPEQMAFLVRYTSGLVCAPASPEVLDKLELPQMVVNNEDPKGTAYTISIDANHENTTTGISAQDRALTCRMLAAADAKPSDLRRPGHVIPLRARPGGVRQRPGHTEAAVDFCKLAGKRPVAVIAELVVDGEEVAGQALLKEPGMMRTEECLAFGERFGLKVCTIEALVAYVEKREGKYVNGSA
jgi:3,4-dihydroxy 2-butanone 4-phosphate synthase